MDATPKKKTSPAHLAAMARYYAKKKQDPEWMARRAARAKQWVEDNRERFNANYRARAAAKRAAAAAASETAPKECKIEEDHVENSLP